MNPSAVHSMNAIDIHTHISWHSAMAGERSTMNAVEQALEDAGRLGIRALCALGNMWSNPTHDGVRRINDVTIEMVAAHPGRVYGLCFINPNLPWEDVEAEVQRCLDAGLHGVKLEYETNARSPRLDPLMELVAARDVFVLHHAWYKTTSKWPNESDPSDIAHLGARHPGTTIVMAHLTAAGIRGVLDIAPYPNILVDTSGSQPFSGIVEYAVDKLGPNRVVFGSDSMVRDFACQLGRILGADLTEQQRTQILYGNAARLLKISGGTR